MPVAPNVLIAEALFYQNGIMFGPGLGYKECRDNLQPKKQSSGKQENVSLNVYRNRK